jgi:serine/threonine protein kinase
MQFFFALVYYRLFVLELCIASLKHVIEGNHAVSLPDDLDSLKQMAEGLCYIRSRNLVHRDIKPENILVSTSSAKVLLKISDFGLSKRTSERGTHSLTGGIKGALSYMSSEYLKRFEKNKGQLQNIRGSTSSDVFSMGCVFYHFVSKGNHPFGCSHDIPVNVSKGKCQFVVTEEP